MTDQPSPTFSPRLPYHKKYLGTLPNLYTSPAHLALTLFVWDVCSIRPLVLVQALHRQQREQARQEAEQAVLDRQVYR